MFLLDVVSPDAAFCHALHEQMETGTGGEKEENSAGFASLAEACKAWEKHTPEFILVDEAALDGQVERLAAFLKSESVPMFLVGETGGKLDALLVTEAFSKPARLGALLARWRFYRRLHANNSDTTIVLGPWRFMPRTRQLRHAEQDESVHLTDKETNLLEYLCQAGEPLTRAEILADVWGYDSAVDTHTLETHITRLRRKLEPATQDMPERGVFLVERGLYRINPSWLQA